MLREAAESGLTLAKGEFPGGYIKDNRYVLFASPDAKMHDSRYMVLGEPVRSEHVRSVGAHGNEWIDQSVEDRKGYQCPALEKAQSIKYAI